MLKVQEYLTADQLATRLGTTKKTICQLAREKVLTRLKDFSYPWPEVEYEWQKYQLAREKQIPTLKDKLAKQAVEAPMLEIPASTDSILPTEDAISQNISGQETLSPEAQRRKDIETLSIGEQIIFALKQRTDGAENSAYHMARALNESVKARTSMLAMLEAEGKTLKREEVESWVYQVSRQNRDLWLNWPQRIATEMAQLLGVDSRLLNDALLKAVHENLERNATLPAEYKHD